MKTKLRKLERVVIDQKVETLFSENFNKAVKACIENFPSSWKNTTYIVGTLCENIQKSDDAEDNVTIPIENQYGVDGGYIHVWGWKVIT